MKFRNTTKLEKETLKRLGFPIQKKVLIKPKRGSGK